MICDSIWTIDGPIREPIKNIEIRVIMNIILFISESQCDLYLNYSVF